MIKIPITRRVLFEKFSPTYNNVEYMVENTLIDCEIYKTKTHNTFFYIKEETCVAEIQFHTNDDTYELSIFFKPTIIYYSLQNGLFESFFKKVVSNLFNKDLDKISVNFVNPSTFEHVVKYYKKQNMNSDD